MGSRAEPIADALLGGLLALNWPSLAEGSLVTCRLGSDYKLYFKENQIQKILLPYHGYIHSPFQQIYNIRVARCFGMVADSLEYELYNEYKFHEKFEFKKTYFLKPCALPPAAPAADAVPGTAIWAKLHWSP